TQEDSSAAQQDTLFSSASAAYSAVSSSPGIQSEEAILIDDIMKTVLEYAVDQNTPLLSKESISLLQHSSVFRLSKPLLLTCLLEHVIRGEYDQAKAMLKHLPDDVRHYLLHNKGTVVDYSGRMIHGTAFQLALGAGDRDMVIKNKKVIAGMAEMIAEFLPP